MSPISNERVEWLKDRLRVIDASIKDLKQRQLYYQQALGLGIHDAARAMDALRAEQLQLSVELSVLTAALAARVAASVSRAATDLEDE